MILLKEIYSSSKVVWGGHTERPLIGPNKIWTNQRPFCVPPPSPILPYYLLSLKQLHNQDANALAENDSREIKQGRRQRLRERHFKNRNSRYRNKFPIIPTPCICQIRADSYPRMKLIRAALKVWRENEMFIVPY